MPILIKDNIDTADKMSTTAGSLALEGSRPAADAFVVERLRAAGAVILGKTNLSEWANFRSTRSSSGWSARGGLVKNPYVLDRNPCGSSSGTGAAIAANLAAIGVGTETDGSIVCPSGANGLVGIKPTVGLVSRTGIIPISHTQDTAGPMARTVADAATLLAAMVERDPKDAATTSADAHSRWALTTVLDPSALKGARIGVARKQYFGYSDAADRIVNQAIADLKAAGAVIVDPADIPTASKLDGCEMEILLYEFKADLNAYLGARETSSTVRSLRDLIAFNEREKEREMPYFGQELFLSAEKKGPLTSPAYRAALAQCRALSRTQGIDLVLRRHRLDAIVAPTGSPAWTTDLDQRRPFHRRQFDAGGGRRLSEHHRAGRPRARSAGRDLVHRDGMVGAAPDRARAMPTSRRPVIAGRRRSCRRRRSRLEAELEAGSWKLEAGSRSSRRVKPTWDRLASRVGPEGRTPAVRRRSRSRQSHRNSADPRG